MHEMVQHTDIIGKTAFFCQSYLAVGAEEIDPTARTVDIGELGIADTAASQHIAAFLHERGAIQLTTR